jgi:uncharacterized protein YraI
MIITSEEFNKAIKAAKPVFVSTSDGINLRSAPSLDNGKSQVIALMGPRAAFKLTGASRVGFVEGTFNGQNGWAFREYLSTPGLTPGEPDTTVMSADGVNLRVEPSLDASVVTLMPNGAPFKMTGDSRLGFLEGTFNNQHGWAYGEYLDRKQIQDHGPSGKFTQAMRDAGMTITQGPWDSFSHAQCACYDFGVPEGTPVFAVAAGAVTFSDAVDDQYRPNKIIVHTEQLGDHLYAHLSQRLVNVGDVVTTETQLGRSGSENGPHLHFQLDFGFSPLGLTVTQTLAHQGFDVHKFPTVDDTVNTSG